MPPTANAPVLDADHVVFITSAVSIVAASCDTHRVPSIGRATGCFVAPDRRAVTIVFARAQVPRLLADIGAGGHIAVVYTRPSTHRALQLKASDARLRALTAGEVARVPAYVEAFGAEITPLGFTADHARILFRSVDGELVGVEFTPTAAFEQTPGPGAGAPIRVHA